MFLKDKVIFPKYVLYIIVCLLFLCGKIYSNSADIDSSVNTSTQLLQSRDYERALKILSNIDVADAKENQKPLILHNKALCYLNLNQRKKACEYLIEIADRYKTFEGLRAVYIELSDYYAADRNLSEAEKYLNRILIEFPEDKYYYYLAKSSIIELKSYERNISIETYSSIVNALEELTKNASEQKVNLKGIIDYLHTRKAFYVQLLNSGKTTEKEYYPNGVLKYERAYNKSVQDGVTKLYYETGELKEESNYKNGSEDGVQIRYYKNGKMNLYYIAKNGEKEGVYKTFYDDGNVKIEGAYAEGKEEGLFLEHNKSGQTIKEVTWKNGKLDGRYILRKGFIVFEFYFNNGKIEVIPLIPWIIVGLLVLCVAIYVLKRIATNKSKKAQ